jgi:hypothetical protein
VRRPKRSAACEAAELDGGDNASPLPATSLIRRCINEHRNRFQEDHGERGDPKPNHLAAH